MIKLINSFLNIFKWKNPDPKEDLVASLMDDIKWYQNQIRHYRRDIEKAYKTLNRLRDELEVIKSRHNIS